MASVNPKTEQARSEGLLPEVPDDDDEHVDVAEEMNLDQQSEQARRVGHAPDDAPGADGQPSPLKPAIDRAVPPI